MTSKEKIIAAISKADPVCVRYLCDSKDFLFEFDDVDLSDVLKPGFDFSKKAVEYGVFVMPFPVVYVEWTFDGKDVRQALIVTEDRGPIYRFRIDGDQVLVQDVARMKKFDYYKSAYLVSLSLFGLLQTVGVPSTEITPTRQQRRAAERSGVPAFSHTVLNLRGLVREGDENAGEKTGTRRLHWRRGHYRRLDSGKITSVRPHLVGNGDAGFADHTFRRRDLRS